MRPRRVINSCAIHLLPENIQITHTVAVCKETAAEYELQQALHKHLPFNDPLYLKCRVVTCLRHWLRATLEGPVRQTFQASFNYQGNSAVQIALTLRAATHMFVHPDSCRLPTRR